jgi:hypothetical protein
VNIVDVVKGCLEGKRYRHYGMYKGYSIRQNTEHFTSPEFLGVYDECGHFVKNFMASVQDLIRDDYVEEGNEREAVVQW